MGVLHSFSIRNIFYDQIDLRLFYFHVTISHISVSLTYVYQIKYILPSHSLLLFFDWINMSWKTNKNKKGMNKE